MKTQPATKFTHWLGMTLTDPQKLSLHKFRMEYTSLIIAWKQQYPTLKSVPPIYYNERSKRWYWSPVPEDQLAQYMAICEAILAVKQFEK